MSRYSKNLYNGIKSIAYQHVSGRVVMVVGFSERKLDNGKVERIVIFRPIETNDFDFFSHMPIEDFFKLQSGTITKGGVPKPRFKEYKP